MSRADRIAQYIERQYVAEDGTARENAEALFARDFVYHRGGETLNREDLIEGVFALRQSLSAGRRVVASGFEENGDAVTWRLSATLPEMGEDGNALVQESHIRAVFNTNDRIRKAWSEDVTTE
jgi:hypothetical protein